MIIGIPTEVKTAEERVAMTPDGVRGLTSLGHQVRVQSGAGIGSSFSDADFVAVGATMVSVEEAWASDLVCKVKEPMESEFGHLREDLVLFTYLHLAAYPEVAKALKSNNAKLLNEMEELTKKTIIIKSDPALHQEQFDIH